MSKVLDDLLKNINDLKDGRLESDIPPGDLYWAAVNSYRVAYNRAGQVHVPVGSEVVEVEVPVEATTESDIDRMIREAKG